MNRKPDWSQLLLYILLFTSVDTVLFGVNSNGMFLYVPRIIGTIYIIINIFYRRYLKKDFVLLNVVIFSSLIVISGFYNQTGTNTILSHLIAIITAYAVINTFDKKKFFSIYDNFMCFISVVALVCEIISYVAKFVWYSFPHITTTAGNMYAVLGIGAVSIRSLQATLIRISAIFWEPGAYAAYLFFAIYTQLFMLEDKSIKRVVIYLLSLLLTFSTAGYIAVGVLIIGFILSDKRNDSISKYKKPLVLFLIISIVTLIFGESSPIYEYVFGKIFGTGAAVSSALARYASITEGLRIGFANPLLGVSPNNIRSSMAEFALTSRWNINENYQTLANTITYHFAAYGVIFGSILVFGLYGWCKITSKKIGIRFILFVACILAFCGETFYSFFPFIFVFYGMQKDDTDNYLSEDLL